MTRKQDQPDRRRRGFLAGALAAMGAVAAMVLRRNKRAPSATHPPRKNPPRWIGHC